MATQTISEKEWAHNAQMEEYRKALYAGAALPAVESEPEEDDRVSNYFAQPVREQAPAHSTAQERIAAFNAYAATIVEPNFFENTHYQNGELVGEVPAMPAPQDAYAAAPVADPQGEESEDARPTPRTMSVLSGREQEQSAVEMQQNFFAALSTKTKIVLASVITAIVLAIIFICVNTAIINSLSADIATKQQMVSELAAQAESIQTEIEALTSPESIAEWASEHGMYLPE